LTAAAFFDLDRTLMAGSSAYHFGRAMYKAGHLTRGQIARDAIEQVRFRLRGASDAAVNQLLARVQEGIKGHRVGILPRVYPQMLDVVRSHQDVGRPCYIATAASQPAAEKLSQALVMEGAIGTRWETDDGVYTGRLEGPFAYGEGKASALREFAAEHGIDLEQSWAYTDAASDLPMLEAVGHPVAVNPDAGLADLARERGWEVLRFEKLGERLRVFGAVMVAAAVGGSGSWLAARRRARAQRGRLRRRRA
jgi:HAD superfamily hydrolase (TIGR01490 family)